LLSRYYLVVQLKLQ